MSYSLNSLKTGLFRVKGLKSLKSGLYSGFRVRVQAPLRDYIIRECVGEYFGDS